MKDEEEVILEVGADDAREALPFLDRRLELESTTFNRFIEILTKHGSKPLYTYRCLLTATVQPTS